MRSPNSNEFIFNQRRVHQAVIPAANGISNAHSLARIYALLIGDVNENGNKTTCLLSKKTLKLTTENMTPPNEPDRMLFGLSTKFSSGGFELHSDIFNLPGEDGFGHRGFGGSLAFATLSRHLAFAYVFNQLDLSTFTIDPRNLQFFEIIDTIIKEKKTS
ncbi:unnamed protein product [Rotaria sordida]|uniref:Beta-lactamase-related domain-containing protein n=1 Tax=Rotaria sordida TaxID=392033 RepID=A0A819M936_9BILA|nr:unnamed protein product [Rotaria sordida]CAF3976561.1 unnamed protein product [Rotaria sordida]